MGDAMPQPQPRFSLLIPAYQVEALLPETLDSVLGQTFGEWEAIVVDDGSADETYAVARGYAERDARVKVLGQQNAGAGRARNHAASVARGQWLLPLDSDDLLLPQTLERLAAFIDEHPGYDLYSCGTWLMYEDHREPFDVGAAEDRPSSFTFEDFIPRNRLLSFTVIDPALFERLGGFSDSYLEDYDFFIRAMAAGARHLHDPELLFLYRVRTDSKNAARIKAAQVAGEVLEGVAEDFELNPDVRQRVLDQAAYCEAMAERWGLEQRLRARDFRGARGAYIRARRAYPGRRKWLAGLAVMAVSPALFTRISPPAEAPDVNVDNTLAR